MSSKTEYLRKTKFREQAVQPQFSWWTSQKFEKRPVESNCLKRWCNFEGGHDNHSIQGVHGLT